MSIPFTQFLMPDGRQRNVLIERPGDIERLATTLIEHGCRFEIEMLSTGQVHMEIMRDGQLLASQLCDNGPPVPDCVDQMIRDAYALVMDEQTSSREIER